MRLSNWARRHDVHPRTALRGFQDGRVPVLARRVSLRTVRGVTGAAAGPRTGAQYARVASPDQLAHLDRQLGGLAAWATAQGWPGTRTVAEVGSGMNGARSKLRRLIVGDAAAGADDRVRDLTEGLTSPCARLYGRQSARTRATRALRGAAQPVETA